ncbi:MAG: hypothetical protein OXE74_08590 [Cyanobacteria bacterium MAG CAR2_bin_4]|nr:hypothetical protein [Cyanobacteria bacterium MAG CAR2_bin_4]
MTKCQQPTTLPPEWLKSITGSPDHRITGSPDHRITGRRQGLAAVLLSLTLLFGLADEAAAQETPNIYFSVSGGFDLLEGSSTTSFSIEATRPVTTNLTINYTLGGTATAGTDYTITGGTVNYAAGTGTLIVPSGTAAFSGVPTLRLNAIADNISDSGETVILTLVAGTGYGLDFSITKTITLTERWLTLSPTLVTVNEGGSASYTVVLGREPTGPVTVAIASDNEDVTVNPSSLTFTDSDWDDPQTVTLTASEDADGEDDSAALSHTASGAGISDDGLTVTVMVLELVSSANPVKAVSGWQVRFGRTVSQQVVEAVQERFSTPPALSGLAVTVAGEELTSTPLAENRQVLAKALGFQPVSTPHLIEASAFSFSPQPTTAAEGGAPRLGIWGSGALSSFRGAEDHLSLDGDVTTALVGADWRTERWQAGAALSHSWGSGSYGGVGADGKVSSSLTGLFPYGHYALTPRLDVWAAAGYGWGSLSLTPDGDGREYEPGANLVMGAVGIADAWLDGGAAGWSLTTTTDLLLVKTTTAAVDGLAAAEGAISRLRVGLEATRPVPLANGAALLPTLEVGMRQDWGDAETGFGLDVGAGMVWHDPARGLRGELRGRTLLTHREEAFREQGLALSFAWQPSPTNRGPALAVSHAMGASASGGMDALLQPVALEGLDGPASSGQRFEAQLAYGFPAGNDRLTLSPGVALALSPGSRTYGLQWSLAPYAQPGQGEPWEVSLAGERREQVAAASPAEHSLTLRFSLLF